MGQHSIHPVKSYEHAGCIECRRFQRWLRDMSRATELLIVRLPQPAPLSYLTSRQARFWLDSLRQRLGTLLLCPMLLYPNYDRGSGEVLRLSMQEQGRPLIYTYVRRHESTQALRAAARLMTRTLRDLPSHQVPAPTSIGNARQVHLYHASGRIPVARYPPGLWIYDLAASVAKGVDVGSCVDRWGSKGFVFYGHLEGVDVACERFQVVASRLLGMSLDRVGRQDVGYLTGLVQGLADRLAYELDMEGGEQRGRRRGRLDVAERVQERLQSGGWDLHRVPVSQAQVNEKLIRNGRAAGRQYDWLLT